MKTNYDTKTDILYIQLSEGSYSKSEKMNDLIIIDISDEGKLMGIEILDASESIRHFNPMLFAATN